MPTAATEQMFCTVCGTRLERLHTPSWSKRRCDPQTGHPQEWVGEGAVDCPQGVKDAILGYECGHSEARIIMPGRWCDARD
jgi:hypothetical protein